tara:strand:+ start:157 stop:396 length:240 start_codon:yes stop_codon:yes gene_type:complete
MIRRETQRKKGWFEEWLDLSFMEKLITIIWCGMPYLLWMMAEGLEIWYRVLTSIVVWILLTLLCWWFGKFMSNQDRSWY